MDRTLNRAKRRNRRRSDRNHAAWRRFSPDGTMCRFCKHDNSQHLCSSGQPHFYRPATEQERRNPSERLYRHRTGDEGFLLVKRMTVARDAELIAAFCTACAEEIGAAQVLCYQRTTAVGEVVGIEANNRIAA